MQKKADIPIAMVKYLSITTVDPSLKLSTTYLTAIGIIRDTPAVIKSTKVANESPTQYFFIKGNKAIKDDILLDFFLSSEILPKS